MKISLNWLKKYIEVGEKSAETISKLLTDTGLEVEGVETFEQIKGGLEGVVIGEVLTCGKHPNADKLSVTTVDIGEDDPVPIVCGASNVAAGQKVAVATVGCSLYPDGENAFKIKKAKIRGEVSIGMICAEDELGLGDDHDGILVLDTNLPNGTPANQHFDIENDNILEIGLTPNRADATGHIGVARDLKAVLGIEVNWPSVDEFKVDNHNATIEVVVEDQKGCPRYSGVSISGVEVKESPDWLKMKLRSIGLSSINNIVDVTNFVLHEVGQPLHAFDADQIKGNKVVVKTLQEGTEFITLDEEKRKLAAKDLMICDGENTGMCIGGVFGGVKSGVSDDTKNVFLECAYFSPDYIRKTARVHGLKTDASFRYERGTDPNITVYALKRAAMLIKEVAGGKISSEVIDIYPQTIENFIIEVKYRNITRLIGKEIEKERIHRILKSLDIDIIEGNDLKFTVSVPPYRVDVTREADIIEEILRIYGFNNVETPSFNSADYLAVFPKKDKHKIRNKVTQLLNSKGYFEIMTNSLTKPSYAELGGYNAEENVEILNKLSEDLGVMRQSLLFTGLEVLAYNINRKQKNIKLLEFGNTYKKQEEKYLEEERMSVFLSGDIIQEHWKTKTRKADYYDLLSDVLSIVEKTTSSNIEYKRLDNPVFEYGIDLAIDDIVVAHVGKVANNITKTLGIKQEIFYGDINWNLLLKKVNDNIVFEEVSRFPEVRRDLSLVIDKSITFEQVRKVAMAAENNLLKQINVFDVYEGDKIDEGKKAYAMSFILEDENKTLTDKVIDKTMNRLMVRFELELDAIIRK
ncbi:MAG: phenylalanine--tRNA ligase subunit beta [Cyclobacteriaceae bacterium]|nr:phenylalanine--tRNA ligase subunit beta [Cyclobacteriaceae bacterium]